MQLRMRALGAKPIWGLSRPARYVSWRLRWSSFTARRRRTVSCHTVQSGIVQQHRAHRAHDIFKGAQPNSTLVATGRGPASNSAPAAAEWVFDSAHHSAAWRQQANHAPQRAYPSCSIPAARSTRVQMAPKVICPEKEGQYTFRCQLDAVLMTFMDLLYNMLVQMV